MNQITILSKLDFVLRIISNERLSHWDDEKLEKELKGKQINSFELENIIGKLLKDGYIKSEEALKITKERKSQVNLYSITFDGKIFIEQGAYTSLNNERNRLSILENRQRKLTVVTFALTLVIAISTLMAGIYYFLEIRHLLENHPK